MPAPLTPFEDRGRVAPWTSRSEEDGWLDDLIEYVDTTPAANTITMTEVGESVDGNPMRLLTIGTGTHTVLWVGQQHGSELAGREALFTTLREWADSTDEDVLDYLSNVTVLIMPTCHPDDLTNRENTNGVNLNRDHVRLTQPETQAIHAVIRDYDPDLIVDYHEGANITADAAIAPPYNVNADSDLVALSGALYAAVGEAIEGAEYTWELYQGPSAMMRGPENLHNNAAVQGRVSMLMETARTYGDDSDVAKRHDIQLLAIDTVWRWHADNLSTVTSTVDAARTRVASRTDPLTLQIETNIAGPEVDPLPVRYDLTDAEWADLALHVDRFDIFGEEVDDGWRIPTAQRQQVLIAYLVDPDSPHMVVAGTRRYTSTPGTTTGRGATFFYRMNGHTFPATLKVKE